ncbi:hypothetical protein C2G38_2047912 [Gigaspora rosea]|uniref:BTB domain-containing protein n=1 Tax=Gigaspora rosea TaxID=44941 RepID=A0A397U495_9GLOM|nr:hypothetical protein C2G38_2047912 [Gigaspora rosea]
MEIKFFESLSKNYLELLNDKEDYNVIINVGESPDTKIFQAHSTILKYRSSYLRNELDKINKNSDNIKIINLKHVSIQLFEIIIKYIYGVISLDNLDSSFIFELMIMSNNFLLEELAKYFENHLIKTKASWLRLRFAHVYKASIQNNNLQDLHNWCNNIIAKYPDKVFDTEDFISLPESALVSLIRRDDLQMDEGKIWKYVITWGIAQNPSLPSNSEDWSNENFQSLKTTLINCLPFIRYFQISNDDIIDNVQPYQRILEKTLWNDILKRLANSDKQISSIILPPRKILIQTLPTRTTGIFSKVISETHAAEIASWIDKKSYIYFTINNPYEFNLILRGSRDGFAPEAFWNLCNNQKNTVVVIKVKNTDEI